MTPLEKFEKLIEAQDLIRSVYCRETGEMAEDLRKVDRSLSKAINKFQNLNP